MFALLEPAFSSFPTMFSTLFNSTFNFKVIIDAIEILSVLDKSEILLSCKELNVDSYKNIWFSALTIQLTVYHIIPTFNDPKEESFGKHFEKRRKCWKPAFPPFPTVFSTLSKREIIISARLLLTCSHFV